MAFVSYLETLDAGMGKTKPRGSGTTQQQNDAATELRSHKKTQERRARRGVRCCVVSAVGSN